MHHIRVLLLLFILLPGYSHLQAQDSTHNKPDTTTVSPAIIPVRPLVQQPPGGSCSISGATSVNSGQSYSYTLSCSSPNITWSASNGSISSSSATSATVTWGALPVVKLYKMQFNDNNLIVRSGPFVNFNEYFDAADKDVIASTSQGTLTAYSNGTLVASITVTISQSSLYLIVPGDISPAMQTISSGSAASILTSTVASGGAPRGTFAYQWQKSTDSVTWTDISGATSLTYSPGSLTAKTYFRVAITQSSQTVYTDVAVVNMSTALVAGTVSPASKTIVTNTSPGTLTCMAATEGTGVYAYQWQSSLDNSTWTDISGETALTYTPGNLTAKTYYRVKVTQGSATVYSNVSTITVTAALAVGTISPVSKIITYNTAAGTLTCTAATGGVGTYTYQWQSSPDNSTWTDISGEMALTYASGNLTTTTYYRVKVVQGSATDYSNTATITVSPPSVDATIPTTPVNLSATQNYVSTWTATAPLSDPTALTSKPLSDVKLTVQYLDGLGRPLQTVAKQGSLITTTGTTSDLVTFQLYDAFSRDSATFLPYVANTSDGSYKTDAFIAQTAFYNGSNAPDSGQAETGSNAYSLTVYEASPLNRVLENFAPGNSWLGTAGQPTEAARHSVKQKYWINTVKDSVRIWNCTYPALGSWGSYSSPTSPFYAAGTLYKTVTVDEAGHQVVEYKDKDGHVVLKKVQLTAASDAGTDNTTAYAGWLCTYYIYDDIGNLRCVVQPEGVKWLAANSWNLANTTILAEQSFRYEYDGRNRMIMKQVPGAQTVYMVYDNRDRLVMTQDADLRAKNSWIVTRYDNLNRADTTWLDSLPSTTFSTLLTAAAATSPYPTTAPTSANLLTATHYDDYTGITYPPGVSGTYKSTWSTYYLAASTTSFPYPVTPAQILPTSSPVTTKGLVTWTQARVLNSNPVVFITTVNIYDDKGRVIQTQSNNITGGANVNTTQYSWAGQPLITVNWQSKLGTRPDTSITVTKLTYDNLNRLVKTEMKQSNSKVRAGAMPTNYITLSQIQYDAIGQVKAKYLGDRKTNDSTYNTTPLEKQYYEYNVRGWLLGVNRAYARDAASTDSTTTTTTTQTMGGEMFTEGMTTLATVTYPSTNYFGFDLGYDRTSGVLINGKSYTTPQYTGNITGMVWKGANDKKARIYNFTYDNTNRLTAANFGQYASGGFSSANVNYTVNNLTYDNNGNIQTMNQYGLKTGSTSAVIDQLSYNYTSSSNKLLNVIDAANDPSSTLEDYHYSGTKTTATVDYEYDANGNLHLDHSKHLTITYNYLNLPQSIAVTDKGTITYVYDAGGNKLKKVTVDNTVTPALTTTTLYLGSSVYQNDTLQFFGTSEGRVRPNTANTAFAYDYFLKDHLGNTRMVLTDDYNVGSPILEATSYYPFGLQQKGIGLEATGSLHNKKLFNGYEQQSDEFADESGLDWYDYKHRFYDDQIGRFFCIDRLADKYEYYTPYQFAGNAVPNAIDVDGLEPLFNTVDTHLAQEESYDGLVNHGILSRADADQQIQLSREGEFQAAMLGLKMNAMILSGPSIAIPWALSDITGAPISPSPQAMAETGLIENEGTVLMGGRKGDIPASPLMDRHEIPSKQAMRDALGVHTDDVPAIQLPTEIHAKTATFGNKPGAALARSMEAQLIKNGEIEKAFSNGIKDVQSIINTETGKKVLDTFGIKVKDVNKALNSMKNYFDKTFKN